MASIRKNKNGTYTATIYLGRDDAGKMIRKYITRDGHKECKVAAREAEEDYTNRGLTNVDSMKVSKYMDMWLEINKPELASTTIKSYRMYIEYHFKPAFGNIKVSQVTDLIIRKYISEKLATLSPTTVRKHYFTLQKMYRDALKHKSPFVGLKPPKCGQYMPTVPTEEQFGQIHGIFTAVGIEEEVVVLLAGWCGMRRGEIFALKWDDIDDPNGYIRIDEAMALKEDDYGFEIKAPKSDKGVRVVAAPDELIRQLSELKRSRKSLQHEIFTITPDSFSSKYSKIMKKNNMQGIRFHDLRHYHASILYKNNVPDLYAAERLGHDIWVLKKIYQHLGLEDKKTIDAQVKNLFK